MPVRSPEDDEAFIPYLRPLVALCLPESTLGKFFFTFHFDGDQIVKLSVGYPRQKEAVQSKPQ